MSELSSKTTTVSVTITSPLFQECASLDAIDHYLAKAEAAQDRINREVARLRALYVRREQQIADGSWPKPKAAA